MGVCHASIALKWNKTRNRLAHCVCVKSTVKNNKGSACTCKLLLISSVGILTLTLIELVLNVGFLLCCMKRYDKFSIKWKIEVLNNDGLNLIVSM